jgi:hypothetical protein
VRHTFIVPVRKSKAGSLALQTGRLSSGERVGLAFTSEASLLLTLGPSQGWIRLGGQALRDMLVPLGIEHIRVDPQPIGQLAVGSSPREPAPVNLARPATSGPCQAGSACPSGHYRSVAKRLNMRRRPLASGPAATRRPGVASLGCPPVTSADGHRGRNCGPRPVGMRSRGLMSLLAAAGFVRPLSDGWPSGSFSLSGGLPAPGSWPCA